MSMGIPMEGDGLPRRRIVQLVFRPGALGQQAYAVANDGTIWRLIESGKDKGAYFDIQGCSWVPAEIPTLPQT